VVTVVERTAQGASATGKTSVAKQVGSIEDLKKMRVFSYSTGDAVFVSDQGKNYIWVANSTFSVDNLTVVLPNSYSNATAPIGRWIVEKTITVESSAQLNTDEVAKATTLVLTKKTIEDLKKARVAARKRNDGVRVADLDATFVWITNSRLKTDDTNVVLPNSYTKATAPVGRWIREGVSLRTGEIPSEVVQPQTPTVTSLNNLIRPVRSVSYTGNPLIVLDTDGVLLVDTTGGNVPVSLPDPATIPTGRFFTIRKVDQSVNVVIISALGSASVDTLSSFNLNNIGGCSLISDGTNYFILP
tara:strand:+ start:143 stop:1045 length:903 start_codon:yes stop_codon:yes gene_type:complete